MNLRPSQMLGCRNKFIKATLNRVFGNSEQNLVSGTDGSRYRPTDFADANSAPIGSGNFDRVQISQFGFDLHLDRPTEILVLHA